LLEDVPTNQPANQSNDPEQDKKAFSYTILSIATTTTIQHSSKLFLFLPQTPCPKWRVSDLEEDSTSAVWWYGSISPVVLADAASCFQKAHLNYYILNPASSSSQQQVNARAWGVYVVFTR
jgi:hypothetical protein